MGAFVSAASLFTTPHQFLGPTASRGSGGWFCRPVKQPPGSVVGSGPWDETLDLALRGGGADPSATASSQRLICGSRNSSSPLPGRILHLQFEEFHRLSLSSSSFDSWTDQRVLDPLNPLTDVQSVHVWSNMANCSFPNALIRVGRIRKSRRLGND